MNRFSLGFRSQAQLWGVSRGRVIFSLVLLAVVLWLLYLIQDGKVAYFEVDTPSMVPTIMQLNARDSFAHPSLDLPDRSWRLQPGQIFVAGDNRSVSLDSRSYGPVYLKDLRGEIVYRVGPRGRRGPVH